MSRIILGIDPGIADTGYGLILAKGNQLKCLAYGSIKTASGLALETRLEILHRELDKIIKKYKPTQAGIEKLFFSKNVKTALIVGQARGVILLNLKQNKIPVSEVSPSQVKQGIATYGQASKTQVQKMIKLILKLDELPQPDDAADALAVAISILNNRV